MDISRHDRHRRLTLVLLVITSLALMSLDERGSGIINSARTAAQDVVSPVQHLADDAFNPVSDWLDGLGRANELQDQNEKLQRELDAAKAEIASAKGSLADLATLKQLMDLPDIADGDAVAADVVGTGAGNFSRTLRISKGSSSGIAKGMPVVVGTNGASALVGQVASVSKSSAIVERIDDANFGVGAQLMQTDAQGNPEQGPKGIAEGQRDSNLLRFSVIDPGSTAIALNKGDVAITLGGTDDPSYPRGLVLGTVPRQVSAGGSIARDAELRPIVDLDSLTIVKVLKYPPAPVP
ncbi:MAG TPA: rod shape-determining protein MreC [Acidimicrobiia bacterium]|nr:rod shape-determining protein MreC [Acidimicrobiia bacterium]